MNSVSFCAKQHQRVKIRDKNKVPVGGWVVRDDIGANVNVLMQAGDFEHLVKVYRKTAHNMGVILSTEWCRQRVEFLICSAQPEFCRTQAEALKSAPATRTGAGKKCGTCGSRKVK